MSGQLRRRVQWRRHGSRVLDEIEDHLRAATDANQKQGMSREDAAQAAIAQLGAPNDIVPTAGRDRMRLAAAMALLALVAVVGLIVGVAQPWYAGSDTTATPGNSSVVGRAPVPDVIGLSVLAATNRLQRAGFAVTMPKRFYLSSQTPQPVVKQESPGPGSMLMRGKAVIIDLENRCCIGSPGVSTTQALIMPNVVGQRLDVAIRQVTDATGFYDVSLPPATATLQPLLATYRVTKQWPQPGYDLRHQTTGFRLPDLSVMQN